MRPVSVFRTVAVLLAIAPLVFGPASSPPSAAAQPRPSPHRKVMVDNADAAAISDARRSGGILLADYGAFSLWSVSEGGVAALRTRSTADVRDDLDTIWLRGGAAIDTRSGPPRVPADLAQVQTSGPRLWLVQFVGPIKEAWLDDLRAIGLEIVFYMPQNAYVVWGDDAALRALDALARSSRAIQFTGPYHPAYRLEPSLRDVRAQRAAGEPLAVTVQIYTTPSLGATLAALRALGGRVHRPPSSVLTLTNISLDLPAGQVPIVAAWADVFNVEPYVAPRRRDEAQGQVVAGNVTVSGRSVVPVAAPGGYLAWLASSGFPTTPASYPIVDVVDDGIDDGSATPLHPDFFELGLPSNPDRLLYNQDCTADPTPNGVRGHGTLNASILGGYNDRSGPPFQDERKFRLGLGISPYGRLAGTKIFRNDGTYDVSACGATDPGVVRASHVAGAAITSNSWGAPTNGAYTASAQEYDALTRDAAHLTFGNQSMLHVFAAGNDGPAAGTIDSPGTAKNVLTVGATENVRDDGIPDGCDTLAGGSAADLASFSARGPTDDGRVKPDIVAPGTHVAGAASQDPGYSGVGVCGAPGNFVNPRVPGSEYYPRDQALYTWSSGTSHSTPAVAGAAALVWSQYTRVLSPGQTPSPAMLKALLLHSARYLDGDGTGGTLPAHGQGWGGVNVGPLLDDGPRFLVDQGALLTATGQVFGRVGAVADPARPLRVTLVWTDAPGSTTGNAYVNDLDLEVVVGGATYRGNVFDGATSRAGGVPDRRNNVERVVVPPGASGQVTVRVVARNLAGDGVFGNLSPLDQDFALVVSNATIAPRPVLTQLATTASDASGNNDGAIDPGETVALRIGVRNDGDAEATGVVGTLSVADGSATLRQATSPYPSIGANEAATNITPYGVAVGPSQACGSVLTLRHTVQVGGGLTFADDVPVRIGTLDLAARTTRASADVPKAIPANDPAGVRVNLPVAGVGAKVSSIAVWVSIGHAYVGDLTLQLISPSGTTVTLADGRGGGGDNLVETVFDDTAYRPIAEGAAPFTGRFRPEVPLSILRGEPIDGTWQLRAVDDFVQDAGTVTAFGLEIQPEVYRCATIPRAPDLALTKSHVGSFTVGQTGAYTLGVTNVGDGPTTDPIVVTDTLPAGLGFVSGSGAGWSCAAAGQTVTCTSPGPLAPGASSSVALAVSVGPATASSVTNVATVSTPGDANAANNAASDPTTVERLPCLPRPPVQVTATRAAPGRLHVTLAAGQAPIRRVHVRFGQGATSRNAIVDVPADPAIPSLPPGGLPNRTTDFTLEVNRPSTSFVVRQAAPGPFTLPLVVEDGCGAWETFVGAGS